ncbi:NodB homology domain-containing protein [Plasmodiophora brassicae]
MLPTTATSNVVSYRDYPATPGRPRKITTVQVMIISAISVWIMVELVAFLVLTAQVITSPFVAHHDVSMRVSPDADVPSSPSSPVAQHPPTPPVQQQQQQQRQQQEQQRDLIDELFPRHPHPSPRPPAHADMDRSLASRSSRYRRPVVPAPRRRQVTLRPGVGPPITFSECVNPNHIALTFDDGPNVLTLDLLDIFKQYDVKATFFIVGVNLDDAVGPKNIEATKRAFDEGHQIASHLWSHPHLNSLDEVGVRRELDQCGDAIEKVIGVRPRYMRPPYGETNDVVRRTIAAAGYKSMMWNCDSNDWALTDAGAVLDNMLSCHLDNLVLLLHEGRQSTVDAVRQFIIETKRDHPERQFVRADQCAGYLDDAYSLPRLPAPSPPTPAAVALLPGRGPPITFSRCVNPNHIALTFDDGPNVLTLDLLDIFKQYDVKATFFIVGVNLDDAVGPKNIEATKRAFDEGHQIASHLWSHPHLNSLDEVGVRRELDQCGDAIEKVIGVRPRYMRPPYGETNDVVRRTIAAAGYKSMMWSCDSNDWALTDAGAVLDNMLSCRLDNLVLLLHEGRQSTVDAVRQFIIETKRDHPERQFVRADQCAGYLDDAYSPPRLST